MTETEFIYEVFRINRIAYPSAQVDALERLCERNKHLQVPFSIRNLKRCEASNGFNHKLDSWSINDWFTAILGELGEAANKAKKLKRIEDGIPGNEEHETSTVLELALAEELADVYIYLDLLAQRCNIDLEKARNAKFEKTSAKIGYVE